MHRFIVNALVIIALFVVALCASVPIFAADSSMENLLPVSLYAKEWVMKDRVTFYNKDTLFDHIDGEAELYFPYGFDLLATATYVNTKNPEVWVVADVYHMGSLLDAFGIYSNYRKADSEWVTIGAEGFVSPSQLMFYQDKYFVRLQATGTTNLKRDIFLAFGQAISQKLPSNTDHPRELEILGIRAVVPKSERYIAQSLLGYDFFHRGIMADANLNGEQVQVFVVPENSQDGARNAFDQYCSYLKSEGKDMHLADTPHWISVSAIDPLYGRIVVEQAGRYIFGAVRLKKTSDAEQLVEQLRGRIVKTPGDL